MNSTFIYYYQIGTPAGTIKLIPQEGGRYAVMFQGENLGSYHSAAAAADDVSCGATFTPSDGTDLGELGTPSDLNEWDRKIFAEYRRMRPA